MRNTGEKRNETRRESAGWKRRWGVKGEKGKTGEKGEKGEKLAE